MLEKLEKARGARKEAEAEKRQHRGRLDGVKRELQKLQVGLLARLSMWMAARGRPACGQGTACDTTNLGRCCSPASSLACPACWPSHQPQVQLNSICARARNGYSKEQLKRDFRWGLLLLLLPQYCRTGLLQAVPHAAGRGCMRAVLLLGCQGLRVKLGHAIPGAPAARLSSGRAWRRWRRALAACGRWRRPTWTSPSIASLPGMPRQAGAAAAGGRQQERTCSRQLACQPCASRQQVCHSCLLGEALHYPAHSPTQPPLLLACRSWRGGAAATAPRAPSAAWNIQRCRR